MSEAKRALVEKRLGDAATKRALQRLREVREAGGTVVDEGDFLSREIEQAYMDAATLTEGGGA